MEALPIVSPGAVELPMGDTDPQLPGGGGGRRLPDAPPQPLYTKAQIARHYGFSIRWVEIQLAKGMPSRLIGGHRRFDLGTVDRWLRATYGGR